MLGKDGLEGVTMAKVAARVVVTAMALYNYFPGKEGLLDAVADSIFVQFDAPTDGCDWEERLHDRS